MDNQTKILNIINDFVKMNKKATRTAIMDRYFELYPNKYEYSNVKDHHKDVIYRSLFGMIKRRLIFYKIEKVKAISRVGNKIKTNKRVYYPYDQV